MVYWGNLRICRDPVCHCTDIDFTIERIDGGSIKQQKKKYNFSLDVYKRKIALGKKSDLSLINKNFAKSFIKKLKEKDWLELETFFISYKRYITNNCNIEELDAEFPYTEIEYDSLLIGYTQIFPFSRTLAVAIDDDEEYLINDQYCLNIKCKCSESVLVFVQLSKDHILGSDEVAVVRYNYKKNKWETLEKIQMGINLKNLMDEVRKSYPNLANILKERHRQLRALYKKYRMKINIHQGDQSNGRIAKNAPCPCGSGKKYKRCCGKI